MNLKATLIVTLLLAGNFAHAESVIKDIDFSRAAFQKQLSLTCKFTTECIDAEACGDTTYGGALIGDAGGAQANDMAVVLTFQSDSGDQEFVGSLKDDVYKTMNIIGGANHMMTIAADGTAHYTVHMPDVPMAITYTGICEDAK